MRWAVPLLMNSLSTNRAQGLPHVSGQFPQMGHLVGQCRVRGPGEFFIPGRFGVRHEDHFYMTESGPRWFTEPAHSIDQPFANAAVFA